MDQHIESRTGEPPAPPWTPDSAYEQTRSELSALPDGDLLIINLDIPVLVVKLLAALPELRALEARMATRWRHPPSGRVDRLERYAWALQHTRELCQGLEAERPDPSAVGREVALIRRRIFACVRTLALAGVLDARLLEPHRSIRSHRARARSICGLVQLCRSHWARIQNQTPLTRADLDHAFARATELLQLLQPRHRLPDVVVRRLRERRQAFTLVLREYGELRRAAQFLCASRAEADRHVPSLYLKKPRAARNVSAAVVTASA